MRDSTGLEPVTTSRSGGSDVMSSSGRYSAAIRAWSCSPRGTPAMAWRVTATVSHPNPASRRPTNCRSVAQKAASGMLLTRAHFNGAGPSAPSGGDPGSNALASRTSTVISMPHVGVGDRDLLVEEPVGGLQLRLVIRRADHGHDVIAGAVSPVEGRPRALVEADRVYLGAVGVIVDALDGGHRGRNGRRLQEEPVADAVGGKGSVDGHRLAQGDPQGQVEQADAGGPLKHLGHTAAQPSVDLDDAGPVGGEFDFGVQATGAYLQGVDGSGGQFQDGRAALGVEGGGDEKAGLSEVFGRREATGQGQVADSSVGHHAFDRHITGVWAAGAGRIVGEVAFEDHVGAAWAESLEQLLEFGGVVNKEGAAAALGRSGLEY